MKLPPPLAEAGLETLANALRAGQTTSFELTQASLARITALEPRLACFLHLDVTRALKHAKAIDDLRNAGVNLGPLMGIPVAVKDHFAVSGMPTLAGTKLQVQDIVPAQGEFVDSMLRAGCVILGKTRATEFALGGLNFDSQPPWNPCDLMQARTTGGSSHGSAVAMAAGLAGFTVGSDTGGSVRWPAALCGVVGFKASSTRWPCEGVFPLSPELDSIGLFTHSVFDAALVNSVLAGEKLHPLPMIDGLTLGLPREHFMEQLDEPVLHCFEEAVSRLRNAGARIVSIDIPEALEIDEIFRSLVPADLLAFLGRERVRAQMNRIDSVAFERLEFAFNVQADDYARMLIRRRQVQQEVTERCIGIDAWLSPTVPMLPEPIANFKTVAQAAAWNRRATRNTRPVNLFGQCSVSLPIHHLLNRFDKSGGPILPVGLQLSCVPGADSELLSIACVIETLLGRPSLITMEAFAS